MLKFWFFFTYSANKLNLLTGLYWNYERTKIILYNGRLYAQKRNFRYQIKLWSGEIYVIKLSRGIARPLWSWKWKESWPSKIYELYIYTYIATGSIYPSFLSCVYLKKHMAKSHLYTTSTLVRSIRLDLVYLNYSSFVKLFQVGLIRVQEMYSTMR